MTHLLTNQQGQGLKVDHIEDKIRNVGNNLFLLQQSNKKILVYGGILACIILNYILVHILS